MSPPGWLIRESRSTKELVLVLVYLDRDNKPRSIQLNQKLFDKFPNLMMSLSKFKEVFGLSDEGLCTQIEKKHEEIVEMDEYLKPGL